MTMSIPVPRTCHPMMRRSARRTMLLCAAALPGMLTGCGKQSDWDKARQAAGDGGAVRQIQTYFDAHRQCVRVLRPARGTDVMEADQGDLAARALLAAGLIEPVAGGSDALRYRPTTTAARWFERSDVAGVAEHQLCFARRQVSYALLDTTGAAPGIRYAFTLSDPAPWLANAAIKAAFPTTSGAMVATYIGQEKLPFRDGRVILDRMEPTYSHPTLFAFGVMFR